ncbi:MAG: GTPase HflX, partial [Candidatus Zixiibacteriota bacterium]
MPFERNKGQTERAYLVGLAPDSRKKADVAESLDELRFLAYSVGAQVVGRRIQVRPKPDPAFYIGRGLVDEIRIEMEKVNADCLIFDDPLAPVQQRNLEEALKVKVIDRPILILDLFATRAKTAAARLQVELAQLEYTLP